MTTNPLSPFLLERYFARYEFSAKYLLSSSDCESIPMKNLLGMADTSLRELWDGLRLGYTESAGHPVLRREIANLYETVWPDDVLVLAPEEGIFVAMNVLLKPGDHAIVMTPAYQSLYQIANSLGVEVTRWELETDGIRWKLNIPALERMIRPSTRLLVINSPHNPTGFHLDRPTFDAIVDIARSKRIILFSDEMYRFAEYREADRLPGACDHYERAITLGGLSKSFGLPGLRTGWLACKDRDLLRQFQGFKDYTTICNSGPGEILAAIALRSRDRILDVTRRLIEDNLIVADQFFSRHHRSFEWIRPMASPVAFPRLKGTDSIDRFCEKLAATKSTLLVPGSMFEFPGNHFRIGLGRQNFRDGLAKLDEFLREAYQVP